jgi:hypothetical protein
MMAEALSLLHNHEKGLIIHGESRSLLQCLSWTDDSFLSSRKQRSRVFFSP